MEPTYSQNSYWGLTFELRRMIAQQLDVSSLIQLGRVDKDILSEESTFTNRLRSNIFKNTFRREEPKHCETTRVWQVEIVPAPPPFPNHEDYQAVLEYNKTKVRELMDLAGEMSSLNPDFKGELLHHLASFIMKEFPSPKRKKDDPCAICNSGQTIIIKLLYRGTGSYSSRIKICYTTLDGWNLLKHIEARVEFLKGFDSPHPIERTVPPMVRVFGTWDCYKYPKIPGHELMYKNIISGLELEVIYNNVKWQYDQSSRTPDSDSDSDSSGTPFHEPFTIDVQTVIIYTLEGAKAFFTILEDRCLLLSFKYAIYDPRPPRNSFYPRSFPSLITEDSTCLTLYRTVHSTEPPENDSGVIRTVYRLLADLTWKKIQPGEEIPTPPFINPGKGRTIITEDLIIPRPPGIQA